MDESRKQVYPRSVDSVSNISAVQPAIVRAIRVVRLSTGQSRNSVSTAAEFFYLSCGFCPRSSHRKAIINLSVQGIGKDGGPKGQRAVPSPPQTDKIRLHRHGAGSGLSLGKWACAWISKFNENHPSKPSPFSPLSSFSLHPKARFRLLPRFFFLRSPFFSPFLHLSFSPLPSTSIQRNRRKRKKYYLPTLHPVTCLFVTAKLDPFRARKEYTYSR